MVKKIKGRFIVEIAGKPQENVDKTLEKVQEKLNEKSNKFEVVESEIIPSELDERTTLYSGMIEFTLKFETSHDLIGFILDYTPTSVELEEPSEIKIDTTEFAGLLNNLSHKMLESLNTIRRLNATAIHLDKELKKLKGRNFK
jgi:hypothetical protein